MIKLTNINNNKTVYINPTLITAIYVLSDYVSIFFDDGNYVHIKESEDEIIAKLYGAELDSYTRTGTFSRL